MHQTYFLNFILFIIIINRSIMINYILNHFLESIIKLFIKLHYFYYFNFFITTYYFIQIFKYQNFILFNYSLNLCK